ncbi:MAG: alpha/beta hydrolase fold domain-containing protein [Rhodoferax sp.]
MVRARLIEKHALRRSYLQGQDAANPKVSPLHEQVRDLPPIRIDVGDDEVLLADSIRYADRMRAAGVEITLSVWKGMPHVFQSSLGKFLAAERSVNAIGEFLRQRLVGTSPSISTPSEA